MAELKLIKYKEERLIYFTDQRKLIKKRYDRLEKAIKPDEPYLSERRQFLSDLGRELSFLNDVIKMLEDDLRTPKERGVVRKAEEEINRQQEEIERLKGWENLLKAEKHSLIKTEAIKEFAKRLKNKIKTECNPYGKPTFDYDTSISIMRYIDNLVKEMVGGEK